MCFDVYDKEEDKVTQTDSYSFWKLTIIGYMGKKLYNIHSGFQLWSFPTIFWVQQVRQIPLCCCYRPSIKARNQGSHHPAFGQAPGAG